ncbi:MAG: 3-oxoacyl-ACP synthase III [Oligoflexia bacterium]|nr:3-oxoacyl-ACP synthase III [Oligoflexia bacterium]
MLYTFRNTNIFSMEYQLPNKILTSLEIENRLAPIYDHFKLHSGRLELMTGIAERRIGEVGQLPSALAISTVNKLIERTHDIDKNFDYRNEIDLLIYASVCRDCLEPATASKVHAALKLKDECCFFDLSNACLGIMNAILLAANLVETKQIKSALVVASENSAPLIETTINHLLSKFNSGELKKSELKKHMASFTIGSGAYAAIVTNSDRIQDNSNSNNLKPIKLLACSLLTNTKAQNLCTGGGHHHEMIMETDSEALLHAGISLADRNWNNLKELLSWSNNSPTHFITHQVGETHQRLLAKQLGIDIGKFYSTFKTLGNTGSVALPISWAQAHQDSLFKKNDQLALLGIGSGLSSIMFAVEYQ